ncbi:DeoR/GlpR family transcriptional regulator of sugar metabolism [Pedobacter sp. UYP24]
MIKEKRFEHILASLKDTGIITYSGISTNLSVSQDTVRRDIDYLYKNGLLSKVKGGAISRNKNPISFLDRKDYESEQKEIIGLKVQPFLKKGMTLFMDGGTTICAVAKLFSSDSSFRIITSNLALVPILENFKNIDLIVLGGTYNRNTQTNVGSKTCDDAKQYVADIYLMSSCAVSVEFGLTSTIQDDGAVKQSLLKGAKKIILLSNSEKIGTNEYFKVCELDKVDILVTELVADDPKLNEIRYIGLTLI